MPPRKRTRAETGCSSKTPEVSPHVFKLLDCVRLFNGFMWQRGVVKACLTDNKYLVTLEGSEEELTLPHTHLRMIPIPPSPPRESTTPAAPSSITSRHPWPRRNEKARICLVGDYQGTDKEITESLDCITRPISDDWDDYDSIFYNAWQEVEMKPTRFVDMSAISHLGFDRELDRLMRKIGLGTMPTRWYPLYPDLARQFLATVRVYYTGEAPVTAQQGVLTFMIRGVRYHLPFTDLCTIYGFRSDHSRCELPTRFPDVQAFWRHFGHGRYDSKTTPQSDIRHPVLRCLARILSHTLLCKMEPHKMRVAELMVMSIAIGDIISDAAYTWPERDLAANLGAVFAHHLVSLKVKPFTSRGRRGKTSGRPKTESVGSLLTPIFLHFGIATASCSIISTRVIMDEPHLEHLRWLKSGRQWLFRSSVGDSLVQLPNTALTTIGTDSTKLFFAPAQVQMIAAQPARRRRASSGRRGSGDDTSGSAPTSLPPLPTMELDPFQQYVVQSLQTMWSIISRCSCRLSQDARTPPPGPSSPTELSDDTTSED